MMDLATHPDERTTLPAIAERQGIPRKFLPTVLNSLTQAGLVYTIRGYGGGVELSCKPAEITVRQIIECVEGRQIIHDCDSRGIDYCARKNDCRLRDLLDRAGNAMLTVLEQTTLADLVVVAECVEAK